MANKYIVRLRLRDSQYKAECPIEGYITNQIDTVTLQTKGKLVQQTWIPTNIYDITINKDLLYPTRLQARIACNRWLSDGIILEMWEIEEWKMIRQ